MNQYCSILMLLIKNYYIQSYMQLKLFFSKFFLLASTNVLGMLASFGVLLVILSVYGTEGLGRIYLVFAVLQYCVLFSGNGIENYIIREVSSKRLLLKPMITSLFVIRFSAAFFIYLLLLISIQIIPSFSEQASLLMITGLTLFVMSFRTTWVAQAQQQSHILGYFNLGLDLSFFLAVLVTTLIPVSLESIIWLKLATEILATLILFLWTNKTFGPLQKPLPWHGLKGLMHKSWHFTFYPVLRCFAIGSDLILLSFFVTTIEVGLYTGASKIFFTLLALAAAYIVIIYPRLSELSTGKLTHLTKELMKYYKVMMPLAIIGALILIVFSEFILVLLFGEEFIVVTSSLQMLAIAFIANFLGRHYRQVLLVTRNQKHDLRIVFFSSVTHVLAKVIFIPLMGISGAALGTAIGEIVMLIAYIIIYFHLFKKRH